MFCQTWEMILQNSRWSWNHSRGSLDPISWPGNLMGESSETSQPHFRDSVANLQITISAFYSLSITSSIVFAILSLCQTLKELGKKYFGAGSSRKVKVDWWLGSSTFAHTTHQRTKLKIAVCIGKKSHHPNSFTVLSNHEEPYKIFPLVTIKAHF